MLELTASVLVEKPAEEVFDLWAQAEKYPDWFPMSLERRPLTEGSVGVGSKFLAVDKMPPGRRIESTLEIKEFNRPSRMTANLSAPTNADWEATFEDEGGKTRMTFTTKAQLSGLQGLLAPLLKGWANRQLQTGLERFKAEAEQS